MAGDTRKPGGLKLVGDVIDNATPAPKVGGKKQTRSGGGDEPELPLLPAGCPVKPLGHKGLMNFFLDEAGQLIAIDPQKLGQAAIKKIFGRQSQLCDEYWPRYSDKANDDGTLKINGWKPEKARDALQRACAFAGIFDPQGKVRDRGAHRGRNGELVLHCGDVIYIGPTANDEGGYHEAGLYDGFVYPMNAEIPRPDVDAADTSTGEDLLKMLKHWEWERNVVDPMLLLGFIVASMIGGALKWRPHAWVTGSTATGKSTLQALLELLMDGGALHTAEASEAALRQLTGQQTLAIFFDELEAEEDNRQGMKVVKLARLASSGGRIAKGGQDHVAHEFVARSCFLFSSILLPPILSQDRNRLAILELKAIPAGRTAPIVDDMLMREWGQKIRRRVVDQWHRLDETLRVYSVELAKNGHSGRGQAQFGTLLACADLVMHDDIPGADVDDDRAEDWGKKLATDTLSEKANDQTDEQEAVEFLSTFIHQARGGEDAMPISRHITRAYRSADDDPAARDRLENLGLKLVNIKANGKDKTGKDVFGASGKLALGEKVYLAIANKHGALEKMFQGKRWSNGVWSQSFGRVDGAYARIKIRFAGSSPIWATAIPLECFVELKDDAPA